MQHLFDFSPASDFTTNPPYTDHPLLVGRLTRGPHNAVTVKYLPGGTAVPIEKVTKMLTGPNGWVETLDDSRREGHVVFTTTINGVTYTVGNQ